MSSKSNAAARASWRAQALILIERELHQNHHRVTGEMVRFWLMGAKRLPAPHHPNVYGAVIRQAVALGLLHPTARTAPSLSPASHGRVRRIYTVHRPRSTTLWTRRRAA